MKYADKDLYTWFENIHGRQALCTHFKIHTKYNSKIRSLNKKFKKYCKISDIAYVPYNLRVIKHNKECFYHLHNLRYAEFYESTNLNTLVNRFEKYVNNLVANAKPQDNKTQKDAKIVAKLTKLDKQRNSLLDAEIERSTEYIKFLNTLKK